MHRDRSWAAGHVSGGPIARTRLYETNTLEPLDLSADEFAALVCHDFEQQGALIKLAGLIE